MSPLHLTWYRTFKADHQLQGDEEVYRDGLKGPGLQRYPAESHGLGFLLDPCLGSINDTLLVHGWFLSFFFT